MTDRVLLFPALCLTLALAQACGNDDSMGSQLSAGVTSQTSGDGDGDGDSDGDSGGDPSGGSDGTAGETDGGETDGDPTGGTDGGTTGGEGTTGGDSDGDTDSDGGTGTTGGGVVDLWGTPNLWYSVDNRLFYIDINEADGTVVNLMPSALSPAPQMGQNGITMLPDGSLVLSREDSSGTAIYHVPDPNTNGGPSANVELGFIADLRIEGLYTDCEGRVYLMDTGDDTTSADGNRLLRFSGDFLNGDLSFDVITDLQNASVADIDDMSPGISENGLTRDGLGFAIDSGEIYSFDFSTGTGAQIASGGTFGIHALAAPFFDDDTARIYIFDSDARLYSADPQSLNLSGVLTQGPAGLWGDAGHSGLAGPLTECDSSFPPG